jgi:hypothetical protein
MPPDAAQSKALADRSAHRLHLDGSFAALPMMSPATKADPMPTRRRVLILAPILFACFGVAPLTPIAAQAAQAADPSALAFVNDIYAAYKGKDAKGHPLGDDRAIRRYFEPSLATLMVKDQKAAAKRSEVGLLDFDPFIDAQDWEIAAFDIAVEDGAPGKATATVKFTNFDKPVTVRLDLVKLKNDWRISDITWMRDGKAYSLRKIYGH